MTAKSPADDLLKRAEALLGSDELAVCTDCTSQPGEVLVAIARRDYSLVVTIPREDLPDYHAMIELARTLGFSLREPTAMERARGLVH